MTHVDHRRAPSRAANRTAGRAANHAGDGTVRKKPNRSHSAVGAAIVAGAAMVATFAFILTNGASSPPSADSVLPPVPETSTPEAKPSLHPAPAISTAKADRQPPVAKQSPAPPNTGPQFPVFKRGQWIAVLDKYPTDAGIEADQLAKNLAARLISAGVPAKALLAKGQYPGLANSSLEAVRDTWVVYLGPTSSSEAALNLCLAPKTQQAYGNPACPTYEPANSPG